LRALPRLGPSAGTARGGSDIEDFCDDCGYDGRQLSFDDITTALSALPNHVRGLLRDTDDATLRRRPGPNSWSALEYVGHLRDLTAYHRWLIERALAEERPVIGPVDPDAAVAAAGYNEADADTLIDQFDRRIVRFCELIATLDEHAGMRKLVVEPGSREIDVHSVARSALHEGHHHTLDLVRLITLP
jgi:hypothetical protein